MSNNKKRRRNPNLDLIDLDVKLNLESLDTFKPEKINSHIWNFEILNPQVKDPLIQLQSNDSFMIKKTNKTILRNKYQEEMDKFL